MSTKNNFHLLARAGTMLARRDFATMADAVWLRWHHLEFQYGRYVSTEGCLNHAHSVGPQLAKVLRALRIPAGSVALDLGVGMGIAALTLSRYFSLVIGVDLSPELIAIAERNMTRMHRDNVELHCADARTFTEGLERVTHIYLFNPFLEPVMAVAMKNVRRSLAKNPRPLTIIYNFPTCHETIIAAGFTHTRTFHFKHSFHFRDSLPVAIYEWEGQMSGAAELAAELAPVAILCAHASGRPKRGVVDAVRLFHFALGGRATPANRRKSRPSAADSKSR
jgi:16S rRNA G966 N2-methylase RsmD